ncbi:DnaJ domain-containing protein [Magnaporthiopsis poae ATCC 64411]|uniref:DnaJ domain-containing protein n=1 Tax=Magnaporthiopsis poae (strain ATCC 64411 / 73-15) TaxID=644358 RepID=A0A0C4E6U6_MAGP6|nr:DnaJ domain-containing protein [Magnaporthiopsis poae ATCC 64411]
MHHLIASRARPRPRQLASLCAACARLATNFSSSSSSFPSSLSNKKAASLPQRSSPSAPRPRARPAPAPAPPTSRCSSSSTTAANPASQDAAAGEEGPSTHPQKQQQQSSEPDYYALFPQTLPAGPPPDGPFEIDVRALRREFLQLQAAVHPDFHHHAASSSSSSSSPGGSSSSRHSAARRQAEAASAHVNAAYKTLASPLLRAQYLLRCRHGLDLAGDEAASLAAPDAAFLAEVMAVQEDIEDAVASKEEEGQKGSLVAVREATTPASLPTRRAC